VCTLILAFLDGFSPILATDVKKIVPKVKTILGGKHCITLIPFCPQKSPISGEEVLSIHADINNNSITA